MSANLADRIARLSPAQRALLEERLAEARALTAENSSALTESKVPGSLRAGTFGYDRRAPGTPVPPSSPQARLWIIQQLDPDTILFNAPGWRHIRGDLNIPALERALDTIVLRHEALRTGIQITAGQPVQVVLPPAPFELVRHDLRSLPPALRKAQVERIARDLVTQPFDLAHDVLLRAALVQLEPDDYVLLTVRHHIANDAWSVAIFNRELAECYRAYTAGEEPQLPALPVQYSDFALWQNEHLAGPRFEGEIEFWRKQLAGAPDLALATDHPRPSRLSYRGTRLVSQLDPALSRSLQDMSRREGVTLFMLLLAAFEVLLARYSGQNDFVVGTNILGRERVEFNDLIGYFANVLALRAQFGDDSGAPRELTFREFLARTRRVVLDSFAHQVPFEKLIWDLRIPRDESRTPLFQVLFQTTEIDLNGGGLPGLETENIFFDPLTTEYDISLEVVQAAGGLLCSFRYSTDLFDAPTIERLSKHYEVLLRDIVQRPDAPVSSLRLLTGPERAQLIGEWNHPQNGYDLAPRAECIHHLVEAQVSATPDAIAAVFKDSSLTYRELNARANQLAYHLQQHGITLETRVGICLERSLDLLVALLAVLKAGGAYVPLDPASPPARLEWMLQDAAPALVLTTLEIARSLPSHSVPVVLLNRDGDSIAQSSAANPQANTVGSNLAYVMYTSGTTGQPKGVMVEHHSLVNHSTFYAHYFDLSPRDRVLQSAPVAFDLAGEEIFPAWLSGAAVVIRPAHTALAAREFLQFVAVNELTVLDLPTAFWHVLVDSMTALDLALLPSVRLVVVGGEKASAQALDRWQAHVGKRVRWVNTYGPTEATIAVTNYEPGEVVTNDAPLPIGRPIANAQIYILDAALEPVPVGVVGDLYIGGAPLARGYLNQPALTAEKFIPNPFSAFDSQFSALDAQPSTPVRNRADNAPSSVPSPESSMLNAQRSTLNAQSSILRRSSFVVRPKRSMLSPQSSVVRRSSFVPSAQHSTLPSPTPDPRPPIPRLYATGDRARFLPDGQIEFHGRRDHQVKLRGFRIELGEIETVLRRHLGVKDCAVVLREDSPGDKRLAAYVVVDEQTRLPNELKTWLHARLPDYMVPGNFHFLDALPLTAQGKVDRRALPAVDSAALATSADIIALHNFVAPRNEIAPRTPAEKMVAAIWKDILHVPRLSVQDNFFDLGGHSLLATLAVARAEAAFVKTIPLRSLFENPSLEAWARVLENDTLTSAPVSSPILPLDRERYRRAVPASA